MENQFSVEMGESEAGQLQAKLSSSPAFCAQEREYALFCYRGMDVIVAWFPKRRRLLVQGKGTSEFVRLMLPGASVASNFSSAESPAPVAPREPVSPHFGVDESGKGDYFGPLVVAGVYADAGLAPELSRIGCRDSKLIADDARIADMAEQIKALPGIVYELLCIGPSRYNGLYEQMGNLNRLLAWGHARVIAALHAKLPSCPAALSDQFANEWVLRRALAAYHLPVRLDQRPRAEQDIAVAAASIIARARFVEWMQQTARSARCELPLGCAPHVLTAARKFVAAHGMSRLSEVAKLHFKLTKEL